MAWWWPSRSCQARSPSAAARAVEPTMSVTRTLASTGVLSVRASVACALPTSVAAPIRSATASASRPAAALASGGRPATPGRPDRATPPPRGPGTAWRDTGRSPQRTACATGRCRCARRPGMPRTIVARRGCAGSCRCWSARSISGDPGRQLVGPPSPPPTPRRSPARTASGHLTGSPRTSSSQDSQNSGAAATNPSLPGSAWPWRRVPARSAGSPGRQRQDAQLVDELMRAGSAVRSATSHSAISATVRLGVSPPSAAASPDSRLRRSPRSVKAARRIPPPCTGHAGRTAR